GSRWIVTLYLHLLHWKTFLLLRDGYDALARFISPSSPVDTHATMMEKLARGQIVPLESPRYRSALSAFEGNLSDLRLLCEKKGIPLILSTQVSNLRNQPPFVSGEPPGKSLEQRDAFRNRFALGIRERAEGEADSALQTFRTLLSEDSLRADTHFEIARCLDTLGRPHEAEAEYVRARDLDELRFRTSSDFNNVIRTMADGHGTSVVDMEDTFRTHSPDSLIGNDFIVEHLHPNSRGSFLMAKAFAEAMMARRLLADEQTWRTHDTVSDSRLWELRPVTALDERIVDRSREVLISGWPFTDHVPVVPAIPQNDTLGQIAEKFTRGVWTWARAHEAAATTYETRGERTNEEKELRALVWMEPFEPGAYLQLARLYVKEGRPADVRSTLLASVSAEPTAAACHLLADLSLQNGNPVEAISWFTKAASLPMTAAERVNTSFGLALACLRANLTGECMQHLQEVLSLDPGHAQARNLLEALRNNPRQSAPSPHR
ncbi:MAG TPA: tetratricopeptide repeat protein, partial [Bacteroidota bacterium]|nr:tetratricopeptide repeat protein [Bacteroidota bacterium]